MIDNLDIAVMTKINDLAERRGLKPYDFVATYDLAEPESTQWILHFESHAVGNKLREDRYDKMLADVGLDSGSSELKGTPQSIVDALDHAINMSPNPRLR